MRAGTRARRGAPWRVALAVGLGLVLGAAAPAGAEVDVEGTWHVLVHYTDAATGHPDKPRWEDRLWVIERKNGRLEWTDHPIVVFTDQTGRFERLGTNRASRVLHYWEPNESQRAEIAAGLEFNTRGTKKKTLRGSDAEGWRTGRGSGYQSARFLTYTENCAIADPTGLPVFQRDDTLGGAGAEQVAGRTRYATTDVREGGDVLVGRYQRDGTRSGSFRLTRSGAAAVVRGSGRTQSERVVDTFWRNAGGQLEAASDTGDENAEAALRRRIEAGTVTEADREAVRDRFEEAITQLFRDQGNDPRTRRAQIQSLVGKIERLYLDEGMTVPEIQELLRRGELRP